MKAQKNKRIFLDHASTTPTLPEVFLAMKPYFSNTFANPSALYSEGLETKAVIEKARSSIADILSAHKDEIIFTGSGTEADNLAIFGTLGALTKTITKPHIVVSALEHPAILEAVEVVKKDGVEVTVLFPNEEGIISPDDVYTSLKQNTVLVSIMYANNEIGTIEPIRDIAKVIRLFRKNKKNQ
jgi:cysteine desulfurase